jgi:hypothetical protein
MRAADNRREPAPSHADGGELPIDAVTLDLAALILGSDEPTVRRRLVDAGLLDGDDDDCRVARRDVEQAALTVYHWRDHLDDVDPYWLSGNRAATVLGVNSSRLRALSARGFVPFVIGADGSRLYRREQLQVIGNARRVRWPGIISHREASP